jgi:hypothetical protein
MDNENKKAIEKIEEVTNDQRQFYTQWLERLQQESWQLELVISGIVLYLVYGVKKYIDDFAVFAEMHSDISTYGDIFEYFHIFLAGSWVIFIINLTTHIVSRGFWIGAIGLRYVSGEVDYESLKYSRFFELYLKRKVGRFDDFIEKIEKFCSILYAYTFLLFFMFLSILIYFGIFILIFAGIINIFGDPTNIESSMIMNVFVSFYFFLGLFYAIDVVFMGPFKKIKDRMVSKIYFYIYSFFNIITLSFLYRILYYNFIDHPYSRRFFWISIPYFLLVFILAPSLKLVDSSYFPVNENQSYLSYNRFANWMYYDDIRSEFLIENDIPKSKTLIKRISLKEYEIKKSMSSFFFRITEKDEEYLDKIHNIMPRHDKGLKILFQRTTAKDTLSQNIEQYFKKKRLAIIQERKEDKNPSNRVYYQEKLDSIDSRKEDSLKIFRQNLEDRRFEAFLSLFEVKIDSISYTDSLDCHYYIHTNGGEKGMRCVFPTDALSNGVHHLRFDIKNYQKNNNDIEKDTFLKEIFEIPILINKSN